MNFPLKLYFVSIVKSSLSHKDFSFPLNVYKVSHFRVKSIIHLSEAVSFLMQVSCAINFCQHF